MKRDRIRLLLTAFFTICAFAAAGQLPSSPCGTSGGKRADVLGTEAQYSSPGASAPVFTIPAGTKSISVYVSSETGKTSGGNDFAQGDEDFLSISAIIDLTSNTSSGYVNYAKSTFMDGSGTNLYGWKNAPLGSFIPVGARIGDAVPELNNVNFLVQGNTLTITQSNSGVHSSFYVQYLSPFNNSLNPMEPQVKALLHGTAVANTDLVMPIPAGADVIFISGKGTNSSARDLNTAEGSEEGYSNLRFTIDLQKGTTTGFITVANGGSANKRSTYAINNLSSSYTGHMVAAGPPAVSGDNTNGKSGNEGSVGIYDPAIYVLNGNLYIKRDADYARDFDDAYVVEFYKRAGQGMSAEFVSSEIQFIPTGLSSTAGVSRTFNIPPGTNAVYLTATGNAVNKNSESNENSLEAYAYIDLTAGTATGYFYQQVGLDQTTRRDDNYAFKGVPLNNSSTRAHTNTVGFKGPYAYDISFSLSADKSQLTVTNKTGLANPDYQLLLSIDNFGSKPDLAFGTPAVTFTKYPGTKTIKTDLTVCNPGAGNSTQGVPFAVYQGNPVTNPQAKLLYTGTLPEALQAGECKAFSFDLDLGSYDNLNIGLTIVLNDDGSYVSGGIGGTVGTVFTLASLASQHAGFEECYYDNNLVTGTIAVNNAPVIDPDPNNSSGAPGTYSYLNYFDAGSTGATIMDADMSITDPDAPAISGATITLTNRPDAGSETLFLNGVLPAGITISGNNTNVVQLSGQASLADYTAAMKMLEYRNSNFSPVTDNRIITTVVTDGIESSPLATTTIVIQTTPRINVAGNGITIADDATARVAADGTDFGMAAGSVITHTFSIHNVGTGSINLTGSPAVTITGAGFSIAAQPGSNALISGGSTTFEISYDPTAQAGGTHTAIVRIQNNDPDADRADYTFTISATINILPTVMDNSVTGEEDHTYEFKATDFSNAFSDGNGTTLSAIRINSLPQHGSLLLNGVALTAGTEVPYASLELLTFVPDAQWNGVTGLDWNATDGTGYSPAPAHLTINITAVNDAPVITLPAGAAVTEDVPFAVEDIVFSDVDVETGTVTAIFSVAGGTLSALSGSGVTVGGLADALKLEGRLSAINAFIAAGKLSYSAPQAVVGAISLLVDISDNGNTGTGGALHDTKSMLLNIITVNDVPSATDDNQTTNEDTPVNGAVSGADADGDVLTFSKGTDPANGTVIVNPDGSYTYTPNANYVGTDHFTITVDDGNGGTAAANVDITVSPVNDAPSGTGDHKTTAEDTPVDGAVSGSDADGDALVFSKASDPVNGAVVVRTDGTYTYTPDANYVGTDIFTITITDGNGGAATVTVNITVSPVNDAPTGTGDNKTTAEDTPVNGAVTGSDTDLDALTFTRASEPANGTAVVNPDGSYTYSPKADYVGTDNFTITVDDGNGGTATVTVNIIVSPVNDAPTGTGDNKTTPEDTPVSGAVSGSDTDLDALTFTKASEPANGTAVVNTDGSYTYSPKADYVGADHFTITVEDGHGGTATVTVNITVSPVNDAPTISDDNKTTEEDTPVNGTVSGADADSDALTFTRASEPVNGIVVVNTDGSYVYTPKADYVGTDHFTVTVADGNGGTATATVNITVSPVNDAPTGKGDNKTTLEDTPVDGMVSGEDADGDALTFTKAAEPAHGAVTVNLNGTYTYTPGTDYVGSDNFTVTVSDGNGGTATVTVNITVSPVNDAPTGTGDNKTTPEDTPVSGVVSGTDADGDVLTFTKASEPANGAVVVDASGSYTYTPSADYVGADNFTVTVSDGKGGTAIVTVNITVSPVNDAPTGTGDNKTTPEDTPVNGAVNGADTEGDALTFTRATEPANGTVIVNPDGSYMYTPKADYVGADHFTITVSDGNGGTATATVNITVTPVNDSPTGTGDSKTTPEDTPVNGAVTGTDTDGDALIYLKATDPVNGTVRVNADGSYIYTPNVNYVGADHFAVTISDGNGGAATATVNITVTPVNDAPAGSGDSKTTDEDTPVSGSVTGTDTDGDQLIFTTSGQPANGTVIVNTNGTYTYTPNPDFSGPDSFVIIVSDGKGGTTTVTVHITVAPGNDAPVGKGDAKSTPEDTPVNGAASGTDKDGDALTFTKASDPLNGSVTVRTDGNYTYTPNPQYNGADNFTVTISDGHGGTATVTVQIEVLPANDAPTGTGDNRTTEEDVPVNGAVTGTDTDGDQLTFTQAGNPAHGSVVVHANGTYTYTPDADYNGTDQFTVNISDGHGGSVTVMVNITVTPVHDVPTGKGDAKTTPEDTPVSGTVTGSTGDRVTLVYSGGTTPAHGSVEVNANGAYTYTPEANYFGQDNFNIIISDKHGGTITVPVNILVTPVNDLPAGTGDEKTTLENTPVSGRVKGSDIDGDALDFSRATNPAHGAATVNADGSYTYTPSSGYTGPDQFDINISDGKGGTVAVTVRITVSPVTGGIALVKTAAPDKINIVYTLTVTNTSNVALHQVTITDPMLGLKRTLPGELQPGASVSVTATYKITQEDRERGKVTNTAEATALTPVNKEVRDVSGTTSTNNTSTVTIVTGAPQAVNDAAGTRVNTPVTVPVLENDNAGASTFNKRSLRIITQPRYGQLVLHGDGRVTYIPESTYRGDDAFTYRVDDVDGYTTNIAAVKITVETEGLEIPTLFTPNGDGKNDVFEIRGLHKYAENELVIVNRWGNEVYRQKNYQSNWRGDGLNEGTYYYLLRVKKTGSSNWEVLKGFTTLIRKFKQ
ncbi:Ig-like domain-containing protein [Chitinophaga lutea]|nr:Ig-like domain-containing protein [Chitinophaga lutea]